MSFCHAIDDICEIGFRIETVELSGFQYCVDDGRTLAAGFGAEEQVILTRDGDAAQSAFGGIIVDADAAVGGVEAQIFPAAKRVVDRFGEIGFGGEASTLFLEIAFSGPRSVRRNVSLLPG